MTAIASHRAAEPFRLAARAWAPDGRSLTFRYAVSGFGDFEERIAFPIQAAEKLDKFSELLDLVHAVLGVSYFKLAPTDTVSAAGLQLSVAGSELVAAIYGHGLNEFRVRNGLPPVSHVPVKGAIEPERAKPSDHGGQRTLVAIGGGKDSAVALEAAKAAGRLVQGVCVNPKPLHRRAAEGAGVPLIAIRRTLDPRLKTATANGGLDGHVPITAVTSILSVLAAIAVGADEVAFANERSADEETAVVSGVAVNHQWSKSTAFEAGLRAALAASGARVRYFSAIRGLSELGVTEIFAGLNAHHGVVSSCNRNFGFEAPDRGAFWCGECSKCAFVSLCLACFLPPEGVRRIFETPPFAKTTMISDYEALTGLTEAKPWECVGARLESAAALHRLARSSVWAEAAVPAALAPRLVETYGEERLETAWRDALTPRRTPYVPEAYVDALQSLRPAG